MSLTHPIARRTFVAELGRGTVALAVLGIVGRSPGSTGSDRAAPGGATASADGGSAPPASPSPTTWHRVPLGFVSAYILARGGEAAIVDAGVPGSEDAIEAALTAAGLGWSSVGHLVLTHRHNDHVGSAAAVLGRAPDATAYAGVADASRIAVPRALVTVGDGDRVFDLEIVTAPGHTPGSICVLDAVAGVLVAGDALRSAGGRPTGPNPQFTEDMDLAMASVRKLAGLRFDTLLVGHGDPVEGAASAAVAEFGAHS